MLIEANIIKTSRPGELKREANEIIAIVVSSIRAARATAISPKSGIRNPK